MKRVSFFSPCSFILLLTLVVLGMGGCSGSGKGGSYGLGSGSTVVSGKVTLSSSIVGFGKPSAGTNLASPALFSILSEEAGQTTVTSDMSMLRKLNASLFETALSNASVDMYDSDHPEWLFPVSSGSTDAEGNYTLTKMTNASKNIGANYADGDDIPAGNYTLVAYSGFGLGQKPIVAVQSIVKNFDGTIPNIDFEVLPSDVNPEVIYMFGTKKISDGTERWGHDDTGVKAVLPANSAIQLTFSLPMWRDSLKTGIEIDPPLAGKWSLSADWLTATYYLDEGVQMTPGQDYTITINGEDSDPNLPRALNVYGNAVKLSATGMFTATAADAIGPTVQWNSPTVIEMGGTVDVTQSFRIESNKPLDVNGINLRGSPSIGVKPGVLFLGKSAAGLFVYEFILGEPLKLDTGYKLTVSGGKDLAGHTINTLTGSITTKNAANTPGIDPNAAPEVQDLQAQVKAVFGKWTRAMNDRNIAQWQSVMSGEFYMEYDVATKSIDRTWDVNRDGRYSLGEYSRQLVTNNFPRYEFCRSTITGVITPTEGKYINVNPLTSTADFDFRLTVASETNLSTCVLSAPKDTYYMTLKHKNGSWKIVRGSIGIDTRDKELNKPNFISTIKLTQSTWPFGVDTLIADGGLLSLVPDNTNLTAKFSWNSTAGVTVYLLIVADERNPSRGFAIAFPSTVLSMSTDQDPILDLKGIDIGSKLGFSTYANFIPAIGGKYRWEVIGLGTATAVPDATNPNDPNFVGNKTPNDLIRDISAVSYVKRFGIGGGIFAELTAEVRAGSGATGTPVVFIPAIAGYDLGTAYQATVTLYTPNLDVPTATLTVTGASRKTYDLSFTDRKATVTVPLYYGRNSFSFYETNVPPGRSSLSKSFQILTLGGKQPPISLWEVSDDLGNILVGDEWYYYTAPGAKKIRIMGGVDDPGITDIRWRLSNSSGSINIFSQGTINTDGSQDNLFSSATMSPPDIEIYQGYNNITLYQSLFGGATYTYYSTNLIVYTDTGSVWVPPVDITGITGAGTTVATKTADYGTRADWNVVFDPAANFTVTVSGKFKNPGTGRYYVSSDGGYSDGNITPDGSGNFSFNVLLWKGWSYINIYDSSNNYYYININAADGKPFVKPTITRIDNNAYDPVVAQNQYTDTNCFATIEGTADPGSMYAYWDGYISNTSYYEYQEVQNTNGTFKFSVPLVGPGGSNNVSLYDFNNRRTSITISTTGLCTYTPPTFSLTAVRDAAGTLLTPSGTEYSAGGTATVTLSGTSNREGAQVTLYSDTCYQQEFYSGTTAADGSWSIPNVKVYGFGSSNWNYLSLRMSDQYQSIYVISTNSASPVLRTGISAVTGNLGAASYTGSPYCGSTEWNAGASTSFTLTGTTTLQSGVISFTDTLNRRGQAQIVNGIFTIPKIPLYSGWNSMWINNYNDPQGSSNHYLQVFSTSTAPRPRFVTITSPAHGATGVTGTQTVSGTIQDTIGSGYSGVNGNIWGYVYSCGSYKYFSNDTWQQQNYGYLPASMLVDSFSMPNADFSTNCVGADTGYIYVDIYDYNTGQSHYHNSYFNYTAGVPTESWGKAGMIKPKPDQSKFFELEGLRSSHRKRPR